MLKHIVDRVHKGPRAFLILEPIFASAAHVVPLDMAYTPQRT